jgi:hypothetical protein
LKSNWQSAEVFTQNIDHHYGIAVTRHGFAILRVRIELGLIECDVKEGSSYLTLTRIVWATEPMCPGGHRTRQSNCYKQRDEKKNFAIEAEHRDQMFRLPH